MHGPKWHCAQAHKGHLCVKMFYLWMLWKLTRDTYVSKLDLLWMLPQWIYYEPKRQPWTPVNHLLESQHTLDLPAWKACTTLRSANKTPTHCNGVGMSRIETKGCGLHHVGKPVAKGPNFPNRFVFNLRSFANKDLDVMYTSLTYSDVGGIFATHLWMFWFIAMIWSLYGSNRFVGEVLENNAMHGCWNGRDMAHVYHVTSHEMWRSLMCWFLYIKEFFVWKK